MKTQTKEEIVMRRLNRFFAVKVGKSGEGFKGKKIFPLKFEVKKDYNNFKIIWITYQRSINLLSKKLLYSFKISIT